VEDPEIRERVARLLSTDPELDVVWAVGTNGANEEALTARELDVLRLMAEGLGNKIIANALGISTHTVKFHVAAVFTKLDVHSRTEAVAAAIRNGLVPL
jgi:DNA-binding NarL/FixJ family response regulator